MSRVMVILRWPGPLLKRIDEFLATKVSRPVVVLEGHCSELASLLVSLGALSAKSELEALPVHPFD